MSDKRLDHEASDHVRFEFLVLAYLQLPRSRTNRQMAASMTGSAVVIVIMMHILEGGAIADNALTNINIQPQVSITSHIQ